MTRYTLTGTIAEGLPVTELYGDEEIAPIMNRYQPVPPPPPPQRPREEEARVQQQMNEMYRRALEAFRADQAAQQGPRYVAPGSDRLFTSDYYYGSGSLKYKKKSPILAKPRPVLPEIVILNGVKTVPAVSKVVKGKPVCKLGSRVRFTHNNRTMRGSVVDFKDGLYTVSIDGGRDFFRGPAEALERIGKGFPA